MSQISEICHKLKGIAIKPECRKFCSYRLSLADRLEHHTQLHTVL